MNNVMRLPLALLKLFVALSFALECKGTERTESAGRPAEFAFTERGRLGTQKFRLAMLVRAQASIPGTNRFVMLGVYDLQLWDWNSGEALKTVLLPKDDPKKFLDPGEPYTFSDRPLVSSDGKTILIQAWGQIYLYPSDLSSPPVRFESRKSFFKQALTPRSNKLVDVKRNGMVEIWDSPQKKLYAFPSAAKKPAELAVNETTIAIADDSGTIFVHDMKGKLLRSLKGEKYQTLFVSENEGTIITNGTIGTINGPFLWYAPYETRASLPRTDSRYFSHQIFGVSGEKLCIGSSGSSYRLEVWDLKTKTLQQDFPPPKGHRNLSAFFAQNGERIILRGSDSSRNFSNVISVFDTKTGEQLNDLGSHTGAISLIRFAGDKVVTSSDDGTTRIWDAKTQTELRRLDHPAFGMAVVPDGETLYYTSLGIHGFVSWNLKENRANYRIKDPQLNNRRPTRSGPWMIGICFFPDYKHLAFFEKSKRSVSDLRIWNIEKEAVTRTMGQFNTKPGDTQIRITSHVPTRQLVTRTDDSIEVWDRESGAIMHNIKIGASLATPRSAPEVVITPNGKLFAAIIHFGEYNEKTVLGIWGLPTGAEKDRIDLKERKITALAMLDDNTALLGDADGFVMALDLAKKAITWQKQAHRGSVTVIEVAPDHRRFASGGADTTAVLWEVGKK